MMTHVRLIVTVILSAASAFRLQAVDTDRLGDGLPEGAIARLGVARPRWNPYVAAAVPHEGGTVVTADDDLNVCHWDRTPGCGQERTTRHPSPATWRRAAPAWLVP